MNSGETRKFNLLNEVDLGILKNLIQATIKILSGETKLESMDVLREQLTPLAEQANESVDALLDMIRILSTVMRDFISHKSSPEQIKQNLNSRGMNDPERIKLMILVLEKYQDMLRKKMMKQSLHLNEVKDMDWRFGVTASSSEMSKVAKTFIQLKLTSKVGEERILELSLPQFYNFLHSIEKAKATIDFFSGGSAPQ